LLCHVVVRSIRFFKTADKPPSQDFSGPPNPLVGSFMPVAPAADATVVAPLPAILATPGNAPCNAPDAAFAAGAASAARPP
jgi:hypothetical protein